VLLLHQAVFDEQRRLVKMNLGAPWHFSICVRDNAFFFPIHFGVGLSGTVVHRLAHRIVFIEMHMHMQVPMVERAVEEASQHFVTYFRYSPLETHSEQIQSCPLYLPMSSPFAFISLVPASSHYSPCVCHYGLHAIAKFLLNSILKNIISSFSPSSSQLKDNANLV
jgi:hypothetical protein